MITVLPRPGYVHDAGVAVADEQELAALLRERRLLLELTQMDVAVRSGLSIKTVSDVEHPVRRARLVSAMRYAAAVGLTATIQAAVHPLATPRRGKPAPDAHPIMAALTQHRRTIGRTQVWVAEQIHRYRKTVSYWELGLMQPLVEDVLWYALAVDAQILIHPTAPAGVL